ncbi:MAG: SRPBCC domain-containing protein [bacterium]|nr:SRPBCC domain-containing protein [bacterium]
MTVTHVHKDTDRLTMTITAELTAPIDRTWQLWQNPRLLERWWGPPTYPATFLDHDLTPGGAVSYFMTGPEGDQHHGWWRILEVDYPRRIRLEDGFADASGQPVDGLPAMVMLVTFDEMPGGGSSMSIETTFPTLEAMQQMVEMGMQEGMTEAMGQIDAILAE